jgi:hypothetical protein
MGCGFIRCCYPESRIGKKKDHTFFSPQLREDANQCLRDLKTAIAVLQARDLAVGKYLDEDIVIKYSVLLSFCELIAQGSHNNTSTVQRLSHPFTPMHSHGA